jgi:hypothetical protein
LVAYTVSFYRATQGSRKDQPTIPLNLSFAVVLYDDLLEFKGSDGEEDEHSDAEEEDGYKAANNRSNEAPQDQSDEEVEDQRQIKDEDLCAE